MSSHREAPEITKDPVADNADVYAFVSPDNPSTVTIITNFVPLQGPAGRPELLRVRRRRPLLDLHRQRRRRKAGDRIPVPVHLDPAEPEDVPLQHGADRLAHRSELERTPALLGHADRRRAATEARTALPAWNASPGARIPERADHLDRHRHEPALPAVQHRAALDADVRGKPRLGGRTDVPTGEKLFCGQRNDPFYVDLGSIFDLGGLRPFNAAHLLPLPTVAGVDGTKALNIHSIAIQIPISMLTKDGSVPTNMTSPTAVLGIWSAASRRKLRVFDDFGPDRRRRVGPVGPGLAPRQSALQRGDRPARHEGRLEPRLSRERLRVPVDSSSIPSSQGSSRALSEPRVPDHLAALTARRADLVAILLTGLPKGVLPSAPSSRTTRGRRSRTCCRLNVAVPPNIAPTPSIYGLLGGDLAGFPNGRRVSDDIVAIELRAIAGATYPLVDSTHTFVPDAAAGALTQGIPEPATGPGDRYLAAFPYVGTPYDGYDTPSS